MSSNKLVTIPKTMSLDPFFRYKREHVKVVYLKSRQTQITNINIICHQLDRPLNIIKKYLQKALSTRISNNFVISGVWMDTDLDNYIEAYIEKYVICETCGNPETNNGHCKACGAVHKMIMII